MRLRLLQALNRLGSLGVILNIGETQNRATYRKTYRASPGWNRQYPHRLKHGLKIVFGGPKWQIANKQPHTDSSTHFPQETRSPAFTRTGDFSPEREQEADSPSTVRKSMPQKSA